MTASDAGMTSTGASSRGVWRGLAALFREPLVGFAIVGAALFGLDALVSEPGKPTIVVSQAGIDSLVEERELILGRSLSGSERMELVEEHIDSEVLAREAIANGLHLSDPKLRARLVSRMAFLLEDAGPDPTAEDLEALRAGRPERYMTPKTVTFRHAFYPDSEDRAAADLARIQAGTLDPEQAGEKFWLGANMEYYAASQLLTVLGAEFVSALRGLPEGQWTGPVRSGRGWHLVLLEGFHAPQPLPAEEIDRRLRADWQEQQVRESRQAGIAALRAGYVIERVGAPAPAEPVRE